MDNQNELEMYKHKAEVWEKNYAYLQDKLLKEAQTSFRNGQIVGMAGGIMLGAFIVYLGLVLVKAFGG